MCKNQYIWNVKRFQNNIPQLHLIVILFSHLSHACYKVQIQRFKTLKNVTEPQNMN